MSSRPSKPLIELVADFNTAIQANNFDALTEAERALDKVVFKRLRRMKYKGYPSAALDKLLSDLPQDYNTAAVNKILELLDSKTPMQRVFSEAR